MSGVPEPVQLSVESPEVVVGAVHATGCRVQFASEGLEGAIGELSRQLEGSGGDEEVRTAVRAMLRWGRYKPTGRGKPASEYLRKAAAEGSFPRVCGLVDLHNLISARFGLPISLVDVERAGTRRFAVRRGESGESYVFNPAGQRIDLEDLLLVACRPDDRPCANPVKDSQETKVHGATTEVLAVLYAPSPLRSHLETATAALADTLGQFEAASGLRHWTVTPA
jgi:DNA/RNA-binding domain of Phe-tRNA-synthetase-like protein